MTQDQIAHQRLQNEHLIGPRLKRPEDVVQQLGAVQAQDYYGAKWALAQRSQNCIDADVEKIFNEGKILRTHALRPTWHFVSPADIRWIQELTAPRVDSFCKYYYRKLELDDATFQKGNETLARVLQGGKQLTRAEVRQAYEDAGIDASGLRLSYLIMRSELDALVCSGAMRGKQHTLELVTDRAPQAKSLPREEALAELTRRYFTSHGPAQIADFAWWSSLAVADIKLGLELIKSELSQEVVDGKTYYFVPPKTKAPLLDPTVHLLPNYDDYFIAFKDHSSTQEPGMVLDIGARDLVFANHIIALNGRLIGGWRRTVGKKEVVVETKLLVELKPAEQRAFNETLKAYSNFLGLPVKLA